VTLSREQEFDLGITEAEERGFVDSNDEGLKMTEAGQKYARSFPGDAPVQVVLMIEHLAYERVKREK
jgi:hypothetical protein